MIIALLVYFAIRLNRAESKAWELVRQARGHEAIDDPNKPGHKVASEWAQTTESMAEVARNRSRGVEGVASTLGRVVAVFSGVLAISRIVASALLSSAVATETVGDAAAWSTVVDGIDVLLWIALVV